MKIRNKSNNVRFLTISFLILFIFFLNLNFISSFNEPIISTLVASDISSYQATLNGRVSYMGDYDVIPVMFTICTGDLTSGGYCLSFDYDGENYTSSTPEQNITTTGLVSQTITGLMPYTTYNYSLGYFDYMRSYAGSSYLTTNWKTFTTSSGVQYGATITDISEIVEGSDVYHVGNGVNFCDRTKTLLKDYLACTWYVYDDLEFNFMDDSAVLYDFSIANSSKLTSYGIGGGYITDFYYGTPYYDKINNNQIAISPDGIYLAFIDDYGDTLIIHQQSGSNWVKIAEDDYSVLGYSIEEIHFSANGQFLILGLENINNYAMSVILIDVGDWYNWYDTVTHSNLYGIEDINSNNNIIAVAWEMETPEETRVYFYDYNLNKLNFELNLNRNVGGADTWKMIQFSNDDNYLGVLNYGSEGYGNSEINMFQLSGTTITPWFDILADVSIKAFQFGFNSQYMAFSDEHTISIHQLNSAFDYIINFDISDLSLSPDEQITDFYISHKNDKLVLFTNLIQNYSQPWYWGLYTYDIKNDLGFSYFPTVSTLATTDLTETSIKLNGRINNLAEYGLVEGYFDVYINVGGFNMSFQTDAVQYNSIGTFTHSLYFPNIYPFNQEWFKDLEEPYFYYRAVLEYNSASGTQYSYGELLSSGYITGVPITNDTINPDTAGQKNVFDEVTKISGLFPDASGLTTRTKFFYVILTIGLVSIVLLLVGGGINGVSPLMLYLVLFINALLFFLFVAIGYIPIITIIMVLMGLIGIVYFKFSSGSEGS